MAALSREIAPGNRGDSCKGDIAAVTGASTMDVSILHEIFHNVAAANEMIHAGDDNFVSELYRNPSFSSQDGSGIIIPGIMNTEYLSPYCKVSVNH